MIRNYLKIAFRNLYKNKGFTFLNILGLSLGLTTCVLIIFYVADELSYDRYNIKSERIFRVNTDLKYGGTETSFAISAPAVADALKDELPEVENTVKIGNAINMRFKKGNENIAEQYVIYTDPSIFSILTLPMLYGNPATALKDPDSMVITESTALKYFNQIDVVGKTIMLATDSSQRKITGVIQDIPAQSHFKANFLLPLSLNTDHSWIHFNLNTYVLLKPGTNYKKVEAGFEALVDKHVNTVDFNYTKFTQKGNYIKLNLIPLTDIHLRSNKQRELMANGNIQYIYIFSAIAMFILMLACINFMNLSTARSSGRAREVGVRKVLGSSRKSLILQFLSESLMVTLLAGVIAFLTSWLLLPFFNQLSGKHLELNTQILSWEVPALVIIVVVVGFAAGIYPAFFLSAFQPINVLKGKIATGFKGKAFRSVLVVFQFSISMLLIIGTLVIYNQLNFIQNKDLGFDRTQVLIIKNASSAAYPEILKDQVKQLPGVVNATLSSYLPTGANRWPNSISSGTEKTIQTELWPVDEDYLGTMGMQLTQGRNFSSAHAADSSALIVNQTAAKMLGFNGDPLQTFQSGKRNYHIIGVVKDFNFNSLRENVTPLVMVKTSDWMASLSVKVNTRNLTGLMTQIENRWKNIAPNQRFEYSFMDDDFNALYSKEERMAKLAVVFTTLAIIIACLGLFGLAAYAAEQRVTEISIRKVLGANVSALVVMLSANFIRLVAVSILIATPLAWMIMHQWLQSFAYRQSINWQVFVVSALGVTIIAFVTISFQCFRAAMVNPVKNLRNE